MPENTQHLSSAAFTAPAQSIRNTVLASLLRIARHHGVDLALPSIIKKYAIHEPEVSGVMLTRIAHEHGFKIKEITPGWEKLFSLGEVWPVLGILKNGQGVIISGVSKEGGEEKVAYLDPTSKTPGFVWANREKWEGIAGDAAYLIKREYRLGDENQPFGLRWFVPELLRQKQVFRDVAAVAITINALALASPIFFQILVDKVLIHKADATLHALIAGMFVVVHAKRIQRGHQRDHAAEA